MIINLTQHAASEEQLQAGVMDLKGPEASLVKDLLTFNSLPTKQQIRLKAEELAEMLRGRTEHAMIGGAPYLMGPLEEALKKRGITPLYAFSVRESVEEVQPDGSLIKKAIFRHQGFVEA